MKYILDEILAAMNFLYVAWNLAWWDHHVQLARMHDARLQILDRDWRELL